MSIDSPDFAPSGGTASSDSAPSLDGAASPDGAAARTAVVIPAAGRGVRLGPGTPKALRDLAGVPMLVHAVRATARAGAVALVVVVAPPDGAPQVRELLAGHGLPATDAAPTGPYDGEAPALVVVPGGETRQESVKRGLDALPATVDTVLVHDAARPLVPAATVDAVADAVRAGAPAVVPALPVADTVKEVEPGPAGAPEPVTGTPDRSRLRAVQTPQGFARAVLVEAHERLAPEGEGATDDAGMVERLGHDVVVVPGHEEAFKVTRPLDLVLAEAVLERRARARV